jgi:hypothetical protein
MLDIHIDCSDHQLSLAISLAYQHHHLSALALLTTIPYLEPMSMCATPTSHVLEDLVLEDLAWKIERNGVCSVEREVGEVARNARQLGVASVAAEILADRWAPNPVRARAYSKVALALASAATCTPRSIVA